MRSLEFCEEFFLQRTLPFESMHENVMDYCIMKIISDKDTIKSMFTIYAHTLINFHSILLFYVFRLVFWTFGIPS